MDNKLIRQFGEDILCYRIRTERQKKRAKHKAFEKHLLRLHREEDALSTQKRNLGWEPLIPPVQKGWKRFFVLREDVKVGGHAELFTNLLRKINTYDWHPRRDFLVRKRVRGRKKYIVKAQQLLSPDPRHFERLGFTEEEKAFFQLEFLYKHWSLEPQPYYVFREPWRFVLRVRPNIISRAPKRDASIESRLKWIYSYLEINNYRGRQMRLLYGYRRWHWRREGERERERNPLKNKPINRIILEANQEICKE
jgi:hypothetical protein